MKTDQRLSSEKDVLPFSGDIRKDLLKIIELRMVSFVFKFTLYDFVSM